MHSQLSDISGTETPGTRKLCRLGVLLLHGYAGNQTTPHILDALETATPGSIRYCLIFAAIPYQRS
jgi:hypothetical protein